METKPLIRCIVLDDEFLAVKLLSGYVSQTAGLELVLGTTNAMETIAAIQKEVADLLFLDVQMPEITGIELMRITRNSAAKVILTTAYAQYAIDGYEHDIIDYLWKPITLERFLIAVNKAKARLQPLVKQEQSRDFLLIKTEYRLQKMPFHSIFYLEALGDYIAFHTSQGKILSLERMKNMEEQLPQRNFLRIHKSFIINIDHINYVERGRIITYKENVRAKLGIKSY